MKPKVSVVTAVRNGSLHIAAAIKSIQRQSFQDWEYLIIDDASEDRTCEIVEDFAANDSRIRLLKRTHCGGPFAAANDGLKIAAGEFIVRLDADDLSAPTRIEKQLGYLKAHPELMACATFCTGVKNDAPDFSRRFVAPESQNVLAWYLSFRCPLIHSSACLRREAFFALGGYRELPLSQDYWLWCELTRRGWLGILPEFLVFFRHHGKRVSVERAMEQMTLAKSILSEHLQSMSGKEWPQDQVACIQDFGYCRITSTRTLVKALFRWCHDVAMDPALSSIEKVQVGKLFIARLIKFSSVSFRHRVVMLLRYKLQNKW